MYHIFYYLPLGHVYIYVLIVDLDFFFQCATSHMQLNQWYFGGGLYLPPMYIHFSKKLFSMYYIIFWKYIEAQILFDGGLVYLIKSSVV